MKNVLQKVHRLFKRNPNHFMAELHSRAINSPLFIHGDLGASLIDTALHIPPTALGEGDYNGDITVHTDNGIAIMDIAGALTSRPVASFCSRQVSYEQIRVELAEQITDDNVKAVVLRLQSPGGEASQNIDLHDFIYSQRGTKPIIAMVDDYAYSACYGIASACDEIWVTNTGGVGSVGVVTYHVDQSDYNSKVGIKVEYIHAGARKVERNPHQPLSDTARAHIQADIDHLYDMFCEAVARGRGLSVEQVKATEAGCFTGVKAIEAGFADVLGTFDQLLAYLSGGEKPTQPKLNMAIGPGSSDVKAELPNGDGKTEQPEQASAAEDSHEDYDAATESQAAADPVSKAFTEAVYETIVKPIVEQTVAEHNQQTASQEDVQGTAQANAQEGSEGLAKTEQSTTDAPPNASAPIAEDMRQAEIRAVCTAAGVPDLAKDFITAGMTVKRVRADLTSLLQAGEVEVESSQKVAVAEPTATTANTLTAASTYAKLNKRGN